jgi:hypothetical protein
VQNFLMSDGFVDGYYCKKNLYEGKEKNKLSPDKKYAAKV